jgi:hypothetical protein
MNEVRDGALIPSRGWGAFQSIAFLLSLPFLIPAAFILLFILHQQIMHYVPRASAVMTIPDLAATVTATAYHDGMRYLDVRVNGRKYVRQLPRPRNIFGLGSTPWFETCIYRTARNEVAFNMWRFVEIMANDAYRPSDGVKALEGATYLGVFQSGALRDDIIFKAAEPPRSAGPFDDRLAC